MLLGTARISFIPDIDPAVAKGKLFGKPAAQRAENFPQERRQPVLFCEHHLSHAASTFYPSPYRNAGVDHGQRREWATTCWRWATATPKYSRSIFRIHSACSIQQRPTPGFGSTGPIHDGAGLSGEPRFAKLILDHLIVLNRTARSARHVVFRLLHQLHHDQRPFCQIIREPVRNLIRRPALMVSRLRSSSLCWMSNATAYPQPRKTNRIATLVAGGWRSRLRKDFARWPSTVSGSSPPQALPATRSPALAACHIFKQPPRSAKRWHVRRIGSGYDQAGIERRTAAGQNSPCSPRPR